MKLSTPVRLALVDDHEVVVEGLTAALIRDPSFQVVLIAHSGAEFLAAYDPARIDVIIIDAVMGEMGGIEVLHALHKRYGPEVRALMISGFGERYRVKEAIEAGARGYVLKTISLMALKEAIVAVSRGLHVFDIKAAQIISPRARLSERQIEVLELLNTGKSRVEIATTLVVSLNTIKTHLNAIYKVLEVNGARGAVDRARELGIVQVDRATLVGQA